jgi:superfamily I DNA/RNA helicase
MVQIPTNAKHMPATAARVWSPYQQALFDDAANGQGNRIVRAVAGSGKTTTGVEMCARLRGSHIYLAFNKAIATELSSRGVNGRTFHSVCYGIVTKHKGVASVTADKLKQLCRDTMKGRDLILYGNFAERLVGLARNAGIGCLVPDVEQAWVDLCEHHDLEPEHDDASFGRGINMARALLEASNESDMVDFDDLLYFAVKDGLVLPRFDNVFVDEAQDTNAIQRALIRKMMKEGTRLFAVGDEAQAIYGFRGADSDSMELLKQEFDCVDMPLTVTYRCPTAVVAYAQQWVSHLEAAPGAPEGEVVQVDDRWTPSTFVANDLVVSRTTAPIIGMAYKLLRARVPCYVLGREIGEGLKALIKKMDALNLEMLEVRLNDWCRRESQKALAKQDDAKLASIQDKTQAILCLVEGLGESDRSIPKLLQVIDALFANKADAVVLCTIHKSKGLEADRVFWLNYHKCPAMWARQPWQQQQEKNLCYVATTRAKKSLFLITSLDA